MAVDSSSRAGFVSSSLLLSKFGLAVDARVACLPRTRVNKRMLACVADQSRTGLIAEQAAPLERGSMSLLPSYLQNVTETATRKLEELAGRGGLEDVLKSFNGFPANILVALAVACCTFLIIQKVLSGKRKQRNLPPAVPGLPFVGNLLQLSVARPHRIFTEWSERYGPIYTIKTGQTHQVILSSPELVKEAIVTKYDSICNRSLGTNLTILTKNRTIIAMGDYGDGYRMLKKMLLSNLMGQNSQKLLRPVREDYLYKSIDSLFDEVNSLPGSKGQVNVRKYISSVLFRLGMHQAFGRDIEKINVPELGGEITRWEIYRLLVQELMRGAVLIDWRDFFPSLKWIPNKKLEDELKDIERRRSVLTKALIDEQKQIFSKKVKADCYCDVVLENSAQLTEDQVLMSVWEPIIESADTTMVTSEWALYELADRPELQEKLYNEIERLVGDRMVTEDDLPNLPYLNAVVKETLRKYSPVPILPPRYVHRDVQLGEYTIPAGHQLIVNIYGVHHDKKRWENPEVWDPSRFMGSEKYDLGVSDMRVMPFGGGKRICAGMTQAFYIVPMIIATFVQHFKWTMSEGDKGVKEDTVYLTTQKLLPLEAIAEPRVPCRINKEELSMA